MDNGEFEHLKLDSMGLNSVELDTLGRQYREAGEDVFRAQYNCGFLILIHGPPQDGDWIDLNTSEASMPKPVEVKNAPSGIRVIPLAKSERNSFGNKVTVGRARNNDVIIRAPKVSKFHATFFPDRKGDYKLQDMGSLNGTVVEGEQLKRKEKLKLSSGYMISFWRFIFKFVDLNAMCEKLREGGAPSPMDTIQD